MIQTVIVRATVQTSDGQLVESGRLVLRPNLPGKVFDFAEGMFHRMGAAASYPIGPAGVLAAEVIPNDQVGLDVETFPPASRYEATYVVVKPRHETWKESWYIPTPVPIPGIPGPPEIVIGDGGFIRPRLG